MDAKKYTRPVTLEFEVPIHLELDETELKWRLAAKLFDEGEITSGQAAIIIGVSKRDFILGVGRLEVSVFQYTPEELEADVRSAMKDRKRVA